MTNVQVTDSSNIEETARPSDSDGLTPQQNDLTEVEESSLFDAHVEKVPLQAGRGWRLVHISVLISFFQSYKNLVVNSYETPVRTKKRRSIKADSIEIEILNRVEYHDQTTIPVMMMTSLMVE